MKFFGKELKFNGLDIYHKGNKPTLGDVGAAALNHNHSKLSITDIRDTAPSPDSFATRELATFFNNHISYGGAWQSGISVGGWGAGYQVWQLSAGSTSSDNEHLYFRRGRGSTWGPLRKIYHEGFKPSPTDIGAAPNSHGHSYNDLSNRPTIPAKLSQLTNDVGFTQNALKQTVSATQPTGSKQGDVWIKLI